MANTKVTQHVIANNAITADQLASAAVTHAKLHATMDLSGKTVTLPAVAIPSSSTGTTQSASDNTTKIATTAYVTTAISNLVDSAPAALDTLNEIAAALGDDANYASTTTAAIAAKLPLAGGTLTGNLVLSGAPSSGLHPATKTYTDTADALKLNLSGGTLTGDLILNTTTALKIPVGTTGQRPSAATGHIRWNTTDGALEVYNGSAWTAVGTGSSNKVLDTFTGNGSNRTFALTVTPANEDAIMVFIDGAYQEKGDYVLTNASLVLGTAPLANEKIAVHTITSSVHDGTSAVNNQFTATANQTAFTLSQDPKSENNTQVYINGVYQQKTDYTVVGTTLTFDTGLTVGDVVEVNMFTVSTLGNTDTVTEGVSNFYHTTARARGAISVSGNAISYNSSTGVLSANFEEGPVFTGGLQGTTAQFSGAVSASEFDLPSSGSLDWGSGDARIREGLVNNYSLSFQTYDGSNCTTALRLDGNNTATFPGYIAVGQTGAPTEALHVNGSIVCSNFTDEEGIFFRPGFSSTNKYNVSILAKDHNGGSADGISINGYDGVSFSTGSNTRNEVMRITGGGSNVGDVLIGTLVNPVGTGLAVNAGINTSTTTAIEIQQTTDGANKAAAALGIAIQNGGASTNAADLLFHTASGGSMTEVARMTSNGTLALRHQSHYGYLSFTHVRGGGNYVNVKTNIYRASKMYMLKILGHISYSGERIDTIITGYAYAPNQGQTASTYHGITNHGTVGIAVYYSSDNYLCFRTTSTGSYNSIDIIGSSGADGYYQGGPIEILAYTSIAGAGNHYA